MDWLFASLDPSRAHEVGGLVSWHARTMVLAWGVLSPLGILIARFFKVMPGQDWPRDLDRKVWWHSHLAGQIGAVCLTLVGMALILVHPGRGAGIHGTLGYALILFAAVQVVSGVFRGTKGGPTALAPDGSPRGDHYDMTPWRLAFEWLHKSVGYSVLILSVVVILQGLWIANAPRWMLLVLMIWWTLWALVYLTLQQRGWAVDTYQAIWGPSPEHPGNRRKPQGWGMVRPRGGVRHRQDNGA
ncbi:MAG: cytochrome b561 domain-containing protein [Pseudomonadota bacterium]